MTIQWLVWSCASRMVVVIHILVNNMLNRQEILHEQYFMFRILEKIGRILLVEHIRCPSRVGEAAQAAEPRLEHLTLSCELMAARTQHSRYLRSPKWLVSIEICHLIRFNPWIIGTASMASWLWKDDCRWSLYTNLHGQTNVCKGRGNHNYNLCTHMHTYVIRNVLAYAHVTNLGLHRKV